MTNQTTGTASQDLTLYQQPNPHDLLAVPADMPFKEKARLLALYTQMKTIEGEEIDNYFGKVMHMTGLFQHVIPAKKAHINRSTGQQVEATDEWTRTVIFVEGMDKPFCLGSEPVAETCAEMISVIGQHGMFPEGESIPFHIDARGKGKGKYYVLIVEEEQAE